MNRVAEESLLTPSEVARMFGVDPKTVVRWAQAGRIPSLKTPGGHRRFYESSVRAVFEQCGGEIRDPLYEYVKWVILLDEPGSVERRHITLNEIIERAKFALRVSNGDESE